jgi:hypothetical protein
MIDDRDVLQRPLDAARSPSSVKSGTKPLQVIIRHDRCHRRGQHTRSAESCLAARKLHRKCHHRRGLVESSDVKVKEGPMRTAEVISFVVAPHGLVLAWTSSGEVPRAGTFHMLRYGLIAIIACDSSWAVIVKAVSNIERARASPSGLLVAFWLSLDIIEIIRWPRTTSLRSG